jgi:hypothetical protein
MDLATEIPWTTRCCYCGTLLLDTAGPISLRQSQGDDRAAHEALPAGERRGADLLQGEAIMATVELTPETRQKLLRGRLLRCAYWWWKSKRPKGWSEARHLRDPEVNLATDAEHDLARAVALDLEFSKRKEKADGA